MARGMGGIATDCADLVIFDNDGVLVDSELLSNRVLAELLTESGHPTTLEDSIARYMGGTLSSVRTEVRARTGRELPAAFEARFEERLYRAFDAELEPVSGIQAVIASLTTPFCVASSGSVERIVRALAKTGLLPYFRSRIYSADQVAHGKPAPDVFWYAARAMGVAPSRAIVVEDSPNGVSAGLAAGMVVLGYARLTPKERLAGAHGIFTSMEELPRLLTLPLATWHEGSGGRN